MLIHVRIYMYMYMHVHVCTGDVESTEPTKMLMRIAEYVDTGGRGGGNAGLRDWFLSNKDEVLSLLANEKERQRISVGSGSQWTPEWYIMHSQV